MDEVTKIFQDIDDYNSVEHKKPKGLGIQTSEPLFLFDNRVWDKDVIYRKVMALVVNSSEYSFPFSFRGSGKRTLTKRQLQQIKKVSQEYNVAIVPSPCFVSFRIRGIGTNNCYISSENYAVKNESRFNELLSDIKKFRKDMFYIFWIKNGSYRYARALDETEEKLNKRALRALKLREIQKQIE